MFEKLMAKKISKFGEIHKCTYSRSSKESKHFRVIVYRTSLLKYLTFFPALCVIRTDEPMTVALSFCS